MGQWSERDCRVTQRPGGRCPPQDWKSKEGVTQRQGAAPRQGLEGKGETGYFLETGSGLSESAGISAAGLSRSPWVQPGPAVSPPEMDTAPWEQLGQLGRQAEGQAPDECPARWQRGVTSQEYSLTAAEPHCEGKDKVGILS